jgi:hypothetical protein
MVSTVLLAKIVLGWLSFAIGGSLSCLLIWLILKHTPPKMKVYGKVEIEYLKIIKYLK